jgi:phosphohistidine phosphatase SixA
VRVHPVLFLTLSALLSALPLQLQAQDQEETLIFLVRHAERADDGAPEPEEDPHLSQEGQARAEALREMLKSAGLTHIHSSNYIRTRETAAPAARAAGLDVSLYDVGALEDFAEELRSTPGRHLVVGHSNSTPRLVAALGGDPHGTIDSMEYDRLYLLAAGPQGVQTILLRFGEPFRSRMPAVR